MKTAMAIMVLGLMSFPALAHDHHTKSFCVAEGTDICAHLGYNEEFTTEKAYSFVWHMTSLDSKDIKDLKLDLWMDMGHGHGHGSAPLEWAQFGPGKYSVSNAYFVMTGEWQVRAEFTLRGQSHQLIIPVQIQK